MKTTGAACFSLNYMFFYIFFFGGGGGGCILNKICLPFLRKDSV